MTVDKKEVKRVGVDKTLVGEKILSIRVKRRETLEQFADQIRLHTSQVSKTGKSNVSKWERGENLPNDITLLAIADLGGIAVEELLQEEAKPTAVSEHTVERCIESMNKLTEAIEQLTALLGQQGR